MAMEIVKFLRFCSFCNLLDFLQKIILPNQLLRLQKRIYFADFFYLAAFSTFRRKFLHNQM